MSRHGYLARRGAATKLNGLRERGVHVALCIDPLTYPSRVSINTWRSARRCRRWTTLVDIVGAGDLMSYGPNFSHQPRRAADLVDKILRGAKPGDIPVEQADKFELVVNLKTAKSLGLTILEAFLLLARADEVIERSGASSSPNPELENSIDRLGHMSGPLLLRCTALNPLQDLLYLVDDP